MIEYIALTVGYGISGVFVIGLSLLALRVALRALLGFDEKTTLDGVKKVETRLYTRIEEVETELRRVDARISATLMKEKK